MIKKILKVCLVGKTNAGKSTFINQVVKEIISISNKKINTTQKLISGIRNFKNYQFIFFDTPGINFLKTKNNYHSSYKTDLLEGINKADIIIFFIDSKKINLNQIKKDLNNIINLNKKIIIFFNKIDLIKQDDILPYIDKINNLFKIESFYPISSKLNIGIDNLLLNLKKFSKKSEWIYKENEITDKDDIFITNECTRNSILKYLHKEIPYNIKIKNKYFKYLKNGHLKIKQNIIINEIRYKKIILGKKGNTIKLIRENSQKDISNIFNVTTHLYIEILKDNA